jgi:hypothetical protein
MQEGSLARIMKNGDTGLPHCCYSKHYDTDSKYQRGNIKERCPKRANPDSCSILYGLYSVKRISDSSLGFNLRHYDMIKE